MIRRLLMAITVIMAFGAVELWGADWKFFGGSAKPKVDQIFVFFDNEGIEYLPNGNVRLWTKVVIASEVWKIAEKKEVIEKAADKFASGYSPPYLLSKPNPAPSLDDIVAIIASEEAANHSGIKPKGRLLFEINCKEKMSRYLSGTSFRADGSAESSTRTPQEWEYISPETNFDTLRKILCKGKK